VRKLQGGRTPVHVRLSLPASAPNTPVFLVGAVFGMLLVLLAAKRA